MSLHLVSNPSHLEAVDPVAMGRARAQQMRLGEAGQAKVLPVLIHGDAAFAGQGIWAETMNLGTMPGFTVGGTIQIIVNNLIGFTADPEECYSSRFSSDIGKRLPIPIFHVNAEDADAAIRVATMAVEYRYTFHTDVIIDLIGYRRHGHSEVDDPTITQPIRYARIKNHPALYEIYARQIGADTSARVKELQMELADAQKQATLMKKSALLAKLPGYWSNYFGGPYKPEYEVDTGLSAASVEEISNSLTNYPRDFHIHPKIKKLLEQRREMGRGERLFDYGMAEALAFGSLLCRAPQYVSAGRIASVAPSTSATACWWILKTNSSIFRSPTYRRTRPGLRSITPSFPKPACWALNTATAATILRPWFCGKRSSATSPTARRSSSTSSSPRVKTNGDC